MKRGYAIKRYEELTITDDFMFGKVMEDKELCRDVLECLLGQPVGELEEVITERAFRYTVDGKPIRLDVYTKDQDHLYDAEMQNLNHRSLDDLCLPKRSRFYQSMMDTDYLQKGWSYRELPEGRVLFLCTFDPFGLGNAKYTFENRCNEEPELRLEDGTEKSFYNCTCQTQDMPVNLRALYNYITTGQIQSGLTRKIEDAVCRAKRNEKWRSEYMKELLHEEDIKAEARAEGKAEGIEQGIEQGKAVERENGIITLVNSVKELGVDYKNVELLIKDKYQLSESEAKRVMELYW
ncbi:MAG: Rpn family recombination-promoting nuclease/putative transposase [Acetatifactor sp.]